MTKVLIAVLLSLGNIGAYAILAVGIVMIYRASRVLNLAHGAMAMIPAYVVYTLNVHLHVPAIIALVLGVAAGGALGYGVERIFIRRLRGESPTSQTVGTVAALGILVAVASKVWGTTPLPSVKVFPQGFIKISQSSISYGQLGLFGVMVLVTGVLFVLFQKTDLGLVMRGTAENRRAAALMGVNPDRVTALAWIIGGSLAGLSGILLASITNLSPQVLSFQALFGFVAALIGGMYSLPAAVGGAAIVGVTQGIVPLLGSLGRVQGAPQLFLAIVGIAVMAYRGRSIVGGADVRGDGSAGIARARKDADGPRARDLPGKRLVLVLGVMVFVAVPFVFSFAQMGSVNQAASYTLVAASLVLLTGWVGQISLGHAAFVGVGAYATGWLASGIGVPFPLNVPLAGVAAAVIAIALGGVAVRVRGLYLAVATLIFSWMASEFLFRQTLVVKHFRIDARPIGRPGTFPFFNFEDRKVFYFIAWAIAIVALYAASNLRDSKTGRAFFAVQGSEMAAASLGINVVRYKLLAFAISGALAGVAGNLVMTDSRAISPDMFSFSVSLLLLSIAVVGGLTSLAGGVVAALIFAYLNYIFFTYTFLGGYLDIVSTGLLVVVLLAYRGGIGAAGHTMVGFIARQQWLMSALRCVDRVIDQVLDDLGWAGRLLRRRTQTRLEQWGIPPEEPHEITFADYDPEAIVSANGNGLAPSITDRLRDLVPFAGSRTEAHNGEAAPVRPSVHIPGRLDTQAVLRAESVTVRFGGLTAVDDVSLEVREGEIVGLIGPNGAGKSVTFNSIAGLVSPTAGRIWLFDRDVSALPVHVRAAMGVARTFQAIQLFPQLTVFDNLLVATHLHNPTGFVTHTVVTQRSLAAEREARTRVQGVVERLDLASVADRKVGDLPFGVLRMVEVARALVTGFKFIMLDEPASGLDGGETEGLTEVLRRLRDEEGMTLLLIEHDVKMVTSVSDYMYVLDRGRLIKEGAPEEVKRDPHVIAAYLGKPIDEPAEVGA